MVAASGYPDGSRGPRYGVPVRVLVDALAARTGGGLTYLRSLLPAALAADPELELVVVVPRAGLLLFVSDAFRRIAEPKLPRTPAPRRTVTVGLDRRFAHDGGAGRFEALRPYMLCVSDVYPYKALPVAVDTFARLARRHPELRL